MKTQLAAALSLFLYCIFLQSSQEIIILPTKPCHGQSRASWGGLTTPLANGLSITSEGPEPPNPLGLVCKSPTCPWALSKRDFLLSFKADWQSPGPGVLLMTRVEMLWIWGKGKCLYGKTPGETPTGYENHLDP